MILLVLLFVAGLLFAVGLYLLISGWFGRWVGSEPHCRKCNYIILHLTSVRCPECGTTVSVENTIIGEHQRRPVRAVVGSILMILACLPMFPSVRNAFNAINWYHYKPASFVLADLDTPFICFHAIEELCRRDSAGKLPESSRQGLIERALRAQSTTPLARRNLLEYLSEAFVNGRLTQAQMDLFMDQAIRMTIAVRPVVAEGDPIPFCVWADSSVSIDIARTYPQALWYQRTDKLEIDGKAIEFRGVRGDGGSRGGQFHFGNHGDRGSGALAGAVGERVIEIESLWTFWHGTQADEAKSRKLGTRTYSAKATYEVVPRDLAPNFELPYTFELHEKVLQSIQPWTSLRYGKYGALNVPLQLTNVPCDVAFDVFVKIDQKEMRVGSVICAKGKSERSLLSRLDIKQPPAKVDILLRSNVNVAKKTLDLTAIYSGEFEFPNVPVVQETE